MPVVTGTGAERFQRVACRQGTSGGV